MTDPQIPQKQGSQTSVPGIPVVLPAIKTMPEKYIGAAPGKPPVVREVVETKVVASSAPPKPVPPKSSVQGSKKRRNIIIVSVIIILAGLGAAAYILFMPAPVLPPPVNTNQPAVNTNINVPPPPPAPVCGNDVLENGEQCDAGVKNGAVDSTCNASCQIVDPKPPPPPNTGVDSDSDGLTDAEEMTIYGTDAYNLDSDYDTFNDGNEVSHLYDPTVKAPALLKDSKVITVKNSEAEGYMVLVPLKWSEAEPSITQFIASAPTGESFSVIVTEKPNDQSLVEWYMSMSPGSSESDVERFKTLQGYDALRSPDRLTAYIDPGNGKLYTLTFNYDDKAALEFRTTYEAFVGGFKVIK